MIHLSYSEILSSNQKLNLNDNSKPYTISILSNVTVNQIKEILEYSIKFNGINNKIKIGEYDNIVQDSGRYYTSDMVIIFFELHII